jgi:homoserine kinase
VTITVPATSANLGPGFDTLGMAIKMQNSVTIKPSKFHSVSLKGEGAKNNKLKDNNMFVTIFNDFITNLQTKRTNYRFEFVNEIPLSRGLGSSSAVITSAIASAYACANVELTKEKLLNLALSYEPHPDNIAPAVMGGFTVSTIENHEVKTLKKTMPNDIQAIVVIPNRPISTAQSRKTLPLKYTKEESIFNLSHSSLLTGAMFSENWDMLRVASQDVFHQQYRMKAMPELFEVQKIALESGALMSTLSGSGSTFFNLVHRSDAKMICKKLRTKFSHFNILIFDLDNDGIVVNN